MEDRNDGTGRGYDELMADLDALHRAYRQKIREGFSDPEGSMKLSEIERLHRELNLESQKITLEETNALLAELDENMLLRKKKQEYRRVGINVTPSQAEERTILTLCGPVTIRRRRLRPADRKSKDLLFEKEHRKSISPVDCYLGLDKLPFKMTADVMLLCAYWAQDQGSFEKAREKIRRTHGLTIDSDTIRKVANYVGKCVYEEDCRRAEEVWNRFQTAPLPAPDRRKPGILYMQAEGSFLPARIRTSGDPPAWENRLALFLPWDNRGKTVPGNCELRMPFTKKEIICCIGSVGGFKKHFLAAALRNGYDRYEKAVLLSDGAEWISPMTKELFGENVIQILDFARLRENVCQYAKAKFYNDRSRYEPWAEEICEKIKNGRAEEVLARDLDSRETYGNTINLYRFISRHLDHMQYPRYRQEGLAICSGHAGLPRLIQKRFQGAGMRWGVETAQYLVTLAEKAQNDLWEREVANLVYRTTG